MALAQGASGIFNAVAFGLAGWAFSHLDRKGYAEEVHRHNIAMENLSREENQWRNQRDQELDRLSKLREERYNALKSEKVTDDNLDFYKKVKEELDNQEEKTKESYSLRRPKIDYKPSTEFQKYIAAAKMALVAGGAVALGSFI